MAQTIVKTIKGKYALEIEDVKMPLYNTLEEAEAALKQMLDECEMTDKAYIYKETKITNGYLDKRDQGIERNI